MAGGIANDTLIGLGSALRKARERRGVTLDAASRDTKLRVDQLRALEAEDFERLLGDVYVRGSLRTYAAYLGLDPDKVVRAYADHVDDPGPPPPPAKLGRVERAIAATRVRDNQRLMVVLAGLVLLVAVVFGLVSRGHSGPPAAPLPSVTEEPEPADRSIDAVVEAARDVVIVAEADGVRTRYELTAGETRTFTAKTSLGLQADDGAAFRLTVNGIAQGFPGAPGEAWSDSWSYGSQSPAPDGT
jgi:cytoskeletal protein RodZ